MSHLKELTIRKLLERLEFNSALYMQTGKDRFLDVVQETKIEIILRAESK